MCGGFLDESLVPPIATFVVKSPCCKNLKSLTVGGKLTNTKGLPFPTFG